METGFWNGVWTSKRRRHALKKNAVFTEPRGWWIYGLKWVNQQIKM